MTGKQRERKEKERKGKEREERPNSLWFLFFKILNPLITKHGKYILGNLSEEENSSQVLFSSSPPSKQKEKFFFGLSNSYFSGSATERGLVSWLPHQIQNIWIFKSKEDLCVPSWLRSLSVTGQTDIVSPWGRLHASGEQPQPQMMEWKKRRDRSELNVTRQLE